MMSEKKLLIALIHNNEQEMPSRRVSDELKSRIVGTNFLEVFEQANFSPQADFPKLLHHLKTQLRIEDSWRQYRGKQSYVSRLKAGVNFIRKLLLLSSLSNVRKREWHIREIECAVSLKHQTAWQQFQESDSDALLVLESDAAWIEDASEEIAELLDLLPGSGPTYLNLAGGLELEQLGIELLTKTMEVAPRPNTKAFSKPVTNTSCAYAINQDLADSFLSYIKSFPEQESLGIDWLINAVFLELARQRQEVTCVHSYPPILHHGSMTGISSSWHPGRG
jgi:GR25 family glycosyltransferase involved in LPS biosynthesis